VTRCSCCNRLMVGGYRAGEERFCSLPCLTASSAQSFCEACVDATTPKSPGTTFNFQSFGTRMYFAKHRCPTCHSVVQTKAICALFVPIFPLGRYRVISFSPTAFAGRALRDGGLAESKPGFEIVSAENYRPIEPR
jgi:hypothetical protein